MSDSPSVLAACSLCHCATASPVPYVVQDGTEIPGFWMIARKAIITGKPIGCSISQTTHLTPEHTTPLLTHDPCKEHALTVGQQEVCYGR